MPFNTLLTDFFPERKNTFWIWNLIKWVFKAAIREFDFAHKLNN